VKLLDYSSDPNHNRAVFTYLASRRQCWRPRSAWRLGPLS
jgi:glutamate formiminotransferase